MAHDGLGEAVGQCLEVFYANYGMVVSIDPDWLQHSMNVLVGLFWWYGLADNSTKSCSMTFQPGALRLGMSAEAKALKFTGVIDSYRLRLQKNIPGPECGFELTMGSMTSHRRCMYRTELSIDWNRLPVGQMEQHPQVYGVSFPRSTKQCNCPFPNCPGSSFTWNGLRSQFNIQNLGDIIRFLDKHPNPLPKCKYCGI